MLRRRVAAALIAGALVLPGACGGDDDDDEARTGSVEADSPDQTPDDGAAPAEDTSGDGLYGPICDLLTTADVDAVLGGGAELDTSDEDVGGCHYRLSDGVTVVTFQVQQGAGYDANLEAFGELASFADVADLGDRATWSDDAFVGGFLMVLSGDRIYTVSGAGSLEASTELIARALAHL